MNKDNIYVDTRSLTSVKQMPKVVAVVTLLFHFEQAHSISLYKYVYFPALSEAYF